MKIDSANKQKESSGLKSALAVKAALVERVLCDLFDKQTEIPPRLKDAMEYMACGKPTLIPDYFTEKMGIRADIIPEDCVILAQPSTTAIAKGILSLLEDDLARDRIGRNARAWVENGFSWDQLAVNYESALLSVSRR